MERKLAIFSNFFTSYTPFKSSTKISYLKLVCSIKTTNDGSIFFSSLKPLHVRSSCLGNEVTVVSLLSQIL